MAIFGVQLVITMVMASFMQKLSPHFSIARWILCKKLVRFVHPSTEELRSLAGAAASGGKGRDRFKDRRNNVKNKEENFTVPRNINIRLESVKVQVADVIQLHFYTEYQWLVDFAVGSIIVYFLTEVYLYLVPGREEFNLSIMWCLIVVGLAFKVLFSLAALYFRDKEPSGERSLFITCGFFFFVTAMIVLVVDEGTLEFGLDKAYSNFNQSVTAFLEAQGLQSRSPASAMGLKFMLATWCGITGAFFTFPGLRFAKMHFDTLKYCQESPFMKLLLHTSFLAPLLLILMWVKPLARDYFTLRTWKGMSSALMGDEVFDTSRLVAVLLVALLRLILMPSYLQSYLNMAHDRLDELKKEAGRIGCVELQKKVARVFYYLCVVAVQYAAPMLMCLFFTLLLKTLGGFSWLSYFSDTCKDPMLNPAEKQVAMDTLDAASHNISEALGQVKRVFTPILYRGILNFTTWWLCFVWFATSTVGLIYHSYFQAQ